MKREEEAANREGRPFLSFGALMRKFFKCPEEGDKPWEPQGGKWVRCVDEPFVYMDEPDEDPYG